MKTQHPLIRALHRKRPEENPFHMPEASRLFELKHEEVPGVKDKAPGHPITVTLHGKIKSVHDDGRSMMDVHQVSTNEESLKKDTDIPMVRTETSMSPGAA